MEERLLGVGGLQERIYSLRVIVTAELELVVVVQAIVLVAD